MKKEKKINKKIDVLNSKTKKLYIELPNYSFRHSPVTSRLFLGRKKLKEQLAGFITRTSTHKGVYLVTGDRGVGKTSLVEEVIKETSLSKLFPSWLKFLFVVLCAILVLQFFLLEVCNTPIKWGYLISGIWVVFIGILAFMLGKYSPYKRTTIRFQKRNFYHATRRVICASAKEFVFIQDIADTFVRPQYFGKTILIVSTVMFISGVTCISPLKIFIVYLGLLIAYIINKNTDRILFEKQNRYNKKLKTWVRSLIGTISLCLLPTSFLLTVLNVTDLLFSILISLLLFLSLEIFKLLVFIKPKKWGSYFYEKTINYTVNYFHKYIRNYSRIYIEINFGQEGQSKRDILRLIARQLQAKYSKYCFSIKHTFIWRTIACIIIFLFTFLFHKSVYEVNILPIIEQQSWYSQSSQKYLIVDSVVNHIYKGIFYIPKYFWDMQLGKCSIEFNSYKHSPINYAFWLIFVCLYLIGKLTLSIIPINTPMKAKRQLKKLNDSITYDMEKSNEQNIGANKSFYNLHVGRSIKKSRNIADEGEIEMELQSIFIAMQTIPLIMCRPEWVIVFDELDKMEPQKDIDDQTKDNILSIQASRKKQAAILKLMSNLKYFLSTAEAQFIFIAGREMYDIYLADISERSNLLGSIFNDVIFVPSFLSEYTEDNAFDMTSMVEEYVCKHIISHYYTIFHHNLNGYKQYLDQVIYKNQQSPIIEREKQKITACLQQFIFYLAYASKGAPQKMVQIFESFIQIDDHNNNNRDNFYDPNRANNIEIKMYRNSGFCLAFDYYDQFMLGMTSYLVAPVMYRFQDSNIQKHSDKLMVSSLRFIDFMFKFHRHNFSWKSLDISPELIEVNRAPELKSIAENLTNYLVQLHIDKSHSGLYEYRFDNLISQEISFISKICEQFSAMFNFSLDESLILKHHYKEMLDEALKRTKDNAIHHSIASLQIVLGDLYFYDDEFEEAATYYKDGIQSLPPKKILFEEKYPQYVYIYIRNMLKLGFVFEKRKQYDFALLAYSELCDDIIKYGLGSRFHDMRLIYLPFLAKLQILEKCHIGGIQQQDIADITSQFACITCGMKENEINIQKAIFYSRIGDILYYKNRNFETKSPKNNPCSACFYYQKALSALLMKQTNLLTAAYLEMKNNAEVKYCNVMAQILSNLGNVFFACDGCQGECRKDIYKIAQDAEPDDSQTSKEVISNTGIISNLDIVNTLKQCAIFIQSTKNDENENENEKFKTILDKEHYTKIELVTIMYSLSTKYYKKATDHKRSAFQITKILQLYRLYAKNIVRDIVKNAHNLTEEATPYIKAKIIRNLSEEAIHDIVKDVHNLSEEAIRCIYVACEGTTILEVNKRKKDFDKTVGTIPLQTILVDSEIKRISILVKSVELKLIKELNKATDNFNDFKETLKTYYNLYITSPYGINYSVSARIFRLSLKSTLNWETYKFILSNIDIDIEKQNQYVEILMFFRNSEKSPCIDYIFGEHYSETGNKLYLRVFEELIAETIFCFKEIIRLSKTVGETLLFNHYVMGDVYYYLSKWTILLESYLIMKELIKNETTDIKYNVKKWDKALDLIAKEEGIIYNEQDKQLQRQRLQHDFLTKIENNLQLSKFSKIEKYMEFYLGKEWRRNISGYYDNFNALSHYYKCKETHEEGKAYFEMISDIYYLKEDLSDRSNHFYMAMERHIINSGTLKQQMEDIKKLYIESGLHDVDNYFI